MLPMGPLMIEHRMIEKMIAVTKKEIDRCEQQKRINPFIKYKKLKSLKWGNS